MRGTPTQVCSGAPHTITLPSLNRMVPLGLCWLRPSANDWLVSQPFAVPAL
ncbi:hypothetical protein [Streptomyces nodosus]|uniref:hypothetical protein n=1 Tax=Streptomyces nodosus TaxID=40318 RepID=UPI00130D9771|nr:hypothetical protein [Streptomyces nodosus]MBB4794499.1 hypothetical protein [Streptomyces nodosus]